MGELLVFEPVQRRSTPEGEGRLEGARRILRIARGECLPRVSKKTSESGAVDLVVGELEHVAGATRLQPLLRAQRLAETRDVCLERFRRGCRRSRAVKIFDQAVGGHDFAAAEQQDRQQRTLARAAEFYRSPAALDL